MISLNKKGINMFKINITIGDESFKIQNRFLTKLSLLFLQQLEEIAKKNDLYRKIIMEYRINTFNYELTEKAIQHNQNSINSDYIKYSYQKNKSANNHYTQVKLQLESLRVGFQKEGIIFSFFLTPETWERACYSL